MGPLARARRSWRMHLQPAIVKTANKFVSFFFHFFYLFPILTPDQPSSCVKARTASPNGSVKLNTNSVFFSKKCTTRNLLSSVRSSKQDQIHASIVSTLLVFMDGMDGRGQVVVIWATNRPDAVDPVLRRPTHAQRRYHQLLNFRYFSPVLYYNIALPVLVLFTHAATTAMCRTCCSLLC